MAKLYAYIAMMMGIEILLAFKGINTGMGMLLAYFDVINTPNVATTQIYSVVSAILLTAGAVSIIVGFFSSNNRESFLLGGVAIFFLSFIADLAALISYMKGTFGTSPVTYMVTFIFGILIVGYLITIIDFWRGTD